MVWVCVLLFLKRAEESSIKGYLPERTTSGFFIGAQETYRFLPPEYFSSTTLAFFGNKVVIFVWTRPYYAIVVENKEVARSNLATLQYLWKTAEEPTREDRKKRVMKL